MSSVGSPRGKLPARVYWVRRVLVLTVFGLVGTLVLLGVTSLLGTESGDQRARQAAAPTRPASSASTPATDEAARSAAATPSASGGLSSLSRQERKALSKKERKALRRAERRENAQAEAARARPVVPQGECEPRTVRISSRVADAFAATDIEVPLDIVTLGLEACSWTFSADTVALDITSGQDRIWSSVECPRRLPTEELVLVPGSSSQVSFTWNGQRSDKDCSRTAGYAYPGWYHVLVAAEGGEPYDQQFELTKAPDEIRTRTPKPKPRPEADQSEQAEAQTEGDPEGRTQSSGRDGD